MKPTKYLVFALTLAVLVPGVVLADPGKGRGNGHGKGAEHVYRFNGGESRAWHAGRGDDSRAVEVIVIDTGDRGVIRDYLRKSCPPGLARKHNGCTPPGHARYRVGERLPDDVVYYPIPDDLRVKLAPVPDGYRYVRVDKDVLLISEAGKKVIDAVTLLSAVGN